MHSVSKMKCDLDIAVFGRTYEARLLNEGFGELAFGGVGVLILRIPSPSHMYFPKIQYNNF